MKPLEGITVLEFFYHDHGVLCGHDDGRTGCAGN